MLCFGSADLEMFNQPLAQLIHKGLLVAEKSRGLFVHGIRIRRDEGRRLSGGVLA